MPKINHNIQRVGTGFASFLSPPGPEVIRFTVGQPDFATPVSYTHLTLPTTKQV